MRHAATVFALAVAFVSTALFAPFAFGQGIGAMVAEYDEPNRASLAAQRNCVEAAYQGPNPSSSCPFETRHSTPGVFDPATHVSGIRILDAFFASDGPGDALPAEATTDGGVSTASPQRFSTARATGGFAPAIIHPGRGWWTAWYGVWDDKDVDGVLEVRVYTHAGAPEAARAVARGVGQDPGPTRYAAAHDNEMLGVARVPIAAFVDPGSHPTQQATRLPHDGEPDFAYDTTSPSTVELNERRGYAATNTYAFFYDGNLLQTYTVTTLANATLAPAPDGRPYLCEIDRCLADVDVYATVAPGPVASLYGSVAAPFVDALPPPAASLLCPNECWMPPLPLPPEGQRLAGPALALAFAPYPQETTTDPAGPHASSASGAHAAYVEGYHGWLDLLPTYFVPAPRQTHKPMVGVAPGGAQAHAPGWLNFEIYTGVWKDLNADGYVGVASSEPHEYGNRPHADDYADARGEYLPHPATNAAGEDKGLLCVTFAPDDTWGAAGVFVTTPSGTPSPGAVYSSRPAGCGPTAARFEAVPGVLDEPSTWHVTGSTRFGLLVDPDPALEGHYWSAFSRMVYFPVGTAGIPFTLCTERVTIQHRTEGVDRTEEVWDCDHVASLV